MDFSPITSAIGGGFGLIGNYLNYKYQTNLANQQNAYNMNMWKLQNEYNSPANQMRRYEEAGLNPALMYGQVTPGNASSAPQQVTPNAPNFSQDMRDLAQAFNIEGLKQAIADTKLKQANAKAAKVAADQASDEYEGAKAIGEHYDFDPSSGAFVRLPQDVKHGVVTYANPYAHYKKMKILADNYRYNSLLVPRGRLIGSQALLNAARGSMIPLQNFILQKRGEMFAPQLRMLNYQSKYFPASYWIGNVKQGLQGITPFIVPFL